jgi:mRNA interferase MazF
VICEPGDVVIVPFPFSERPGAKRRPALALSSADFNRGAGHTVLAMITTSSNPAWPGDVAIERFEQSGLPRPCVVRLKVFTIDNRLVLRRAGRLAEEERRRVGRTLRQHLPVPGPSK